MMTLTGTIKMMCMYAVIGTFLLLTNTHGWVGYVLAGIFYFFAAFGVLLIATGDYKKDER